MQKFQFLLLTFWFEAPVLLRTVILLMYSYVGYPENTLCKQLNALYLFQAHMSVLLLSKEADLALGSPNPFSIPLKCCFDSKSIGRFRKHTKVLATKKYLQNLFLIKK
jgi:hypothetical protein